MKAQGIFEDVAIVTMSDFGRTLTWNGAGTDHGWGGIHFVAGGLVRGGEVFGKYPTTIIDDTYLNIGRGRLIPTTPYEAEWQAIAQWFGIDTDEQLDDVLPNLANFDDADLLTTEL